MFKPGDCLKWSSPGYEALVTDEPYVGYGSPIRTDEHYLVFHWTKVSGLYSFKVGEICYDTQSSGGWELLPDHDPFNQIVSDYCQQELGRV